MNYSLPLLVTLSFAKGLFDVYFNQGTSFNKGFLIGCPAQDKAAIA